MSTQTGSGSTTYNIQPLRPETLSWDPADVVSTLKKVADYAETTAANAINWYWSHKVWKARLSQAIQVTALASTALAGLFPVLVFVVPSLPAGLKNNSGLAASVFVGIAAA